MVRFVDVLMAFPSLLLGLIVLAVLGTSCLIDAPWLSVAPGASDLVGGARLNLVGDALRDVIDLRLRV